MLNTKLKRIIAIIVAVLLLATAGVSVALLGKDKEFTVTFNAGEKEGVAVLAEGYDESYLVQTVTSASQLKPPKFISEDGYHNGWNKVIKKINSDTTVSALWQTRSFTLKFEPNASDVTYCQDAGCTLCKKECVVTSVKDANLPQHWTRPGYDLDKTWNDVKNNPIEIPEGENPVIVLKANWIPKEYKISFVDEDGETKLFDDMTVKYNNKVGELPVPTSDVAEFANWYVNNTTTIISADTVYSYLDNIVLRAVWLKEGEYVITYVDAGDVNNISKYKKSDDDIYLNNPTRKGYEFTGWSGEGIEKNENGYYIPSGTEGNLTVTANWKAKIYNISLDGVGGTLTTTQKQFTYGQPVGELPQPTKDGYKFNGWQTANGMVIDKDYVWDIDDSSVYLIAKYLRYYTIKYKLEYKIYEGSKYESLVKSKFASESAVKELGFIESETEDGVYYIHNVLEGTLLDESKFLFAPQPLDTEEYYFSAWKFRKGSRKVSIKSGAIVNSETFAGAEESGIIELMAGVGAYWTPGYV